MPSRKTRGPTADDQAEYARIVRLLEAGKRHPLHVMQSTLARIEKFWRPIQPALQILDVVSPKRGIVPSEAEAKLVAGLMHDPSLVVRQHVVRALRHATTHRALVVSILRVALAERDSLLRMAAAVATFELGAGAELQDELLGALESPTWKVRWYAAAALASTPYRERAAEVFAASYPENGNRFFEGAKRYTYEWHSLAEAFAPWPPAIGAKLESLGRRE